jgi:hypothetical protein
VQPSAMSRSSEFSIRLILAGWKLGTRRRVTVIACGGALTEPSPRPVRPCEIASCNMAMSSECNQRAVDADAMQWPLPSAVVSRARALDWPRHNTVLVCIIILPHFCTTCTSGLLHAESLSPVAVGKCSAPVRVLQ